MGSWVRIVGAVGRGRERGVSRGRGGGACRIGGGRRCDATGRCMCHTIMRIPFEVDDVVAMVRKVFSGRVRFHAGTWEIAPGISMHKVGGHSKGLQCVRVQTRRGPVVLASDASHLYAHMDEARVFPVTYNVAEVLEGYETIKRLAQSPRHVIPGHDPEVATRSLSCVQRGKGKVLPVAVWRIFSGASRLEAARGHARRAW